VVHALERWEVDAHEALAIGDDDGMSDQQAAGAAAVRYINWRNLFYAMDQMSHIVQPSAAGSRVVAPASFSTGRM
jgi:hypothetical protein